MTQVRVHVRLPVGYNADGSQFAEPGQVIDVDTDDERVQGWLSAGLVTLVITQPMPENLKPAGMRNKASTLGPDGPVLAPGGVAEPETGKGKR